MGRKDSCRRSIGYCGDMMVVILLLLLTLNDYHILEPRDETEVRLEISNNGAEWDIVGKKYIGYHA